MATSRPPFASVLLTGLVDDAGLFPPTALPMAEACRRYRDDLRRADAMLSTCLLCPASRVDELLGQLRDGDRFRLGLIADTGPDTISGLLAQIDSDERLAVRHVEVPLASVREAGSGADVVECVATTLAATQQVEVGDRASAPGSRGWPLPLYVEPARWDDVDELVAALVRARLKRDVRLKLRCGGVRTELFPSPQRLARVLRAAARSAVPLKATVGLHRATRHRDPATGFTHHGFLNLLAAVADAVTGGPESAVVATLHEESAARLIERLGRLDSGSATAVREVFVGYGASSTRTAVAEADELGLR